MSAPWEKGYATITLIWPRDTKVMVVNRVGKVIPGGIAWDDGKLWQRLPDGRIEATYTREQLDMCLEPARIHNEVESSNEPT